MTDKETVLAKWPGARADRAGVNGRWHIYTTSADGINTFGSGTTESEAWANAAKGLE